MPRIPPRVSLASALLTFWLALAPLNGVAAARSVRGYIIDVLADGNFRIENGPLVMLSSTTSVVRANLPYSGKLAVGWEVKVTGRPDSAAGALRAERVVVLAAPEGAVEGTAVVEERHESPDRTVLVSDGRHLSLTGQTRFVPPNRKEQQPLMQPNAVPPGVFVHYRGRRTEAGVVQVDEISAWSNRLEEKERSLYQKYEPTMRMPREAAAGPAVLQVGKSRYRVLDDRELQLYLDRLGTRLLPEFWQDPATATRHGYRFWFAAVLHERPQASAFPGGVVVIHSGLFRLAQNEAQLAFALAHEIAHVLQEHLWREYLYRRGKLLFLRWSTAGTGYIVESAIRRGYQRDLEAQADRLALSAMARAGYDPREGIRFLRQLERHQQGPSALLWDTHKNYGQRRRALLGELAAHSARGLPWTTLRRDSPEFAALRERIRERRD